MLVFPVASKHLPVALHTETTAHLVWGLLWALEQALCTEQLSLHALTVQDVLQTARNTMQHQNSRAISLAN